MDKREFFGDNYNARADILSSQYARIIFGRGWFIEFPLLFVVCYFLPWEILYKFPIFNDFFYFTASIIKNINENKLNSEFSEYAVAYLSFIHTFGIFSLVFPVFFIKKSAVLQDYVKKSKKNPYWMIFLGFLLVSLLTFLTLNVGAVTYFDCLDCSYHNKLSLVAGGIVSWVLINFLFAFWIALVKIYF